MPVQADFRSGNTRVAFSVIEQADENGRRRSAANSPGDSLGGYMI